VVSMSQGPARPGDSRSRRAEHGRRTDGHANLRDDDLQQELGKFVGINSTQHRCKWTNCAGPTTGLPWQLSRKLVLDITIIDENERCRW
jgi:hypothetical protein